MGESNRASSGSAPLKPVHVREPMAERKVAAWLLVARATAGVPAPSTLVGDLVAGVSDAPFFTFVTFVIALVPAVRASKAAPRRSSSCASTPTALFRAG